MENLEPSQAVDGLLGALRSNFADLAQRLPRGATVRQIETFKRRFESPLPPTLLALYARHDGSGKLDPFLECKRLHSLKEIVATKTVLHEVFGLDWRDTWVPIFSNEVGVVALDLLGSFGGEPGQILNLDTRGEDHSEIAFPSFPAWVAYWTKVLDAGQVEFDADLGLFVCGDQETARQELKLPESRTIEWPG